MRWNCASGTGAGPTERDAKCGLTNRGTGGSDADGAGRGGAHGVSSPSSGHSYTASSDHSPRIRSFSCFKIAIAARNRAPGQRARIVRRRPWATRSRRSMSTGSGGNVGMTDTLNDGHENSIQSM